MSAPTAQAAGQWSGWFDFFPIGDAPLIDCEHFISCFVDSRWPDNAVDVGPEDAALHRFLKSEGMREAVLDACRDGQLTPRDGGGLKIRALPAHSEFEPLRLFFKPDQFMTFAVGEWDIRPTKPDETFIPQGTDESTVVPGEELTRTQRAEIVRRKQEGESVKALASEFGKSRSYIYRLVREAGDDEPNRISDPFGRSRQRQN